MQHLLTAASQNIRVGLHGYIQGEDVTLREKKYRQNSQHNFTLKKGPVFPGTYG